MVYTFLLSIGTGLNLILLVMPAMGVFVIAMALISKKKNENTRGIKTIFYTMLGIGVFMIALGIFLMFQIDMPASISIGNGWVSTNTNSLFGTGNINITATQISGAYIANIKTGNITLSFRKDGTSNGYGFNTGLFLLSNGATANVASSNSTDIIIKLNDGGYVILGDNDTSLLASVFSKNVYNIS